MKDHLKDAAATLAFAGQLAEITLFKSANTHATVGQVRKKSRFFHKRNFARGGQTGASSAYATYHDVFRPHRRRRPFTVGQRTGNGRTKSRTERRQQLRTHDWHAPRRAGTGTWTRIRGHGPPSIPNAALKHRPGICDQRTRSSGPF